MNSKMKVAVIGIDSSHTLEYVRRMQDAEFDKEQQVDTLQAVSCMTLVTPFQNEEGVAARSELLRELNVAITEDFTQAVADAEAIMVELNEPSTHLEYMTKCVGLGKPVFLDKPMAESYDSALKIAELVKADKMKFFTSSPLRFSTDVQNAKATMANPDSCILWGPIGKAAAGSDLVWYGIHLFEMLNLMMGRGATGVQSLADEAGLVCVISYPDGRRGVLELTTNCFRFGGILRDRNSGEHLFSVNAPKAEFYGDTIKEIERFFQGGEAPVELEDSLDIMKMISAADESLQKNGEFIKI